MICNGMRWYYEADKGDNINHFAEEVVKRRKHFNCNIIAKFNDIYIDVDDAMTAEDIVKKYFKSREEI